MKERVVKHDATAASVFLTRQTLLWTDSLNIV